MGRYDKENGIVEVKTRYHKKNIDTAKFKLSGRLYDVLVPRLATLTEFEMENLPKKSTYKDRYGIEKNRMDELVHVRISIMLMAEYFDLGYSLKLVYPNEIKELYTDIEEYLDNRGNVLKYSPNGNLLKNEHLISLDNLANSIMELNRDVSLLGNIKPLMFVPKNSSLVNRPTDKTVVPKRRVEGSPIAKTLTSGRFLGRDRK